MNMRTNRLNKHFTLCAAAVATAAVVSTTNAADVWSGLLNIPIPFNWDGLYVNVQTGAIGSSSDTTAGWDVNPYGTSTTAISLFAATGTGYMRNPGTTLTNRTNLAFTTAIDAAAVFYGSSTATLGGLVGQWTANTTGVFGFKFIAANGMTHYGWMRLRIGETTSTRSIVDWAYNSDPSAIFLACWGSCLFDPDGDEIHSTVDNCGAIYNPTQANNDGDSQGDACDADDDNDGIDDASDGCPFDANKSAPGLCGCGFSDTDSDGDSVADCIDNCVAVSNPSQVDCNGNGIGDACESFTDCNSNAIPDSCDIATGASNDVDSDGVPDECNPDCNNNDLPDAWEIAQGLVADCNSNGIPDSCENDSRVATTGKMGSFGNGVPAVGTLSGMVSTTTAVTLRIEAVGDLGATTEYASLKLGQTVVGTLLFQTTGHDCPVSPDIAILTLTTAQWNTIVASVGSSGNVAVMLSGSPLVDAAQCGSAGYAIVSVTYGGPAYDCDGNGLSDLCEVGSGTGDCNNNAILDACELLSGSAPDIDANGVIDSCQTDCNGNGLPDTYEVAQGLAPDCNGNGIPDSCDIAGGTPDCNNNGVPDACDIAGGTPDCNANGVIDSCDIAGGSAPDCNGNGIPDSCDIAGGTPDCNNNGVPDACDIAAGEIDKNADGQPDDCQYRYGDFDLNGTIDGGDLAVLFALWGVSDPVVGDITDDGLVNAQDLAVLLARWGPIP